MHTRPTTLRAVALAATLPLGLAGGDRPGVRRWAGRVPGGHAARGARGVRLPGRPLRPAAGVTASGARMVYFEVAAGSSVAEVLAGTLDPRDIAPHLTTDTDVPQGE